MSENTINQFDPDGVGIRNGNYFGMPFDPEDSQLVLISVPWDVTSSYGAGSASAPDAIIEESTQLDFLDPYAPGTWRKGIGTVPVDYSILEKSQTLREDARRVIEYLENGGRIEDNYLLQRKLDRINAASAELNARVYEQSRGWFEKGKSVGLVGGDHSVPYGLIRAAAESGGTIGILHLDAHCDLREAYEGFTHSHASIMFNALKDIPQIEKLVQVGVRDFSQTEWETAASDPRIVRFAGADLAEAAFEGQTWADQCQRIAGELPEKVYVSFDIDFLSPEYCPGTGTPVPGGASFDQAAYLLRKVVDSGRRIIGFDLCEVSPGGSRWDASVGARVLFKLCGQTLRLAEQK